MKRLLKVSLTALVLVLSLANCGKSGSSTNNDPNTYYPYNPSYTNPNQYNAQYNQMYGQGNYCQNYGNSCVSCNVPQCDYYSMYYGGGCGNQTVVYDPRNYYGQGNQFVLSASW